MRQAYLSHRVPGQNMDKFKKNSYMYFDTNSCIYEPIADSSNDIVSIRQDVISWTNDDQKLRHRTASIDHKGLSLMVNTTYVYNQHTPILDLPQQFVKHHQVISCQKTIRFFHSHWYKYGHVLPYKIPLNEHYNDVIMTTIASQITSLTIVCSSVY